MSLNRIDVEVTDAVAPSIQTKIDGIADSAVAAQNAIDKLQKALKQLDAQPFVALAKAYSQLTDEVNKNQIAYLKQETALQNAIAAETKAQTALVGLQSAQAKMTAASDKQTASNNKLADSHIGVYNALQKQKQAADAQSAQTSINALLGVGTNSSKSASDSASVFNAAFKQQAIDAKAAAIAQAELDSAAKKAAASIAAEAAAIANLKAAEKAIAAQQDFNAILGVSSQSNNSAKASASAFIEAFAAEEAAAKKAASEVNAAAVATHGLSFETTAAKRELLVLAHELSQGNYKRFGGSMLVIAEQTGAASLLFSAAGLTALGFAAALAGVAYEALAGANGLAEMSRTLQSVNGASGLTVSGAYALADAIAAQTNSTKASTRESVQSLAATGQLQSQQIGEFAASANILSKLTGQSTDDIVKDFAKAAEAPAKYAEELDKQLNFLTTAQLEHIKSLDEMGDKQTALAALSKDLYDYLAGQPPATVSALSQEFTTLGHAISNAAAELRDFLNPTQAQQLSTLQQKLADLNSVNSLASSKSGDSFFSPNGSTASRAKQAADLRNQIAQIQASQAAGQEQADTQADTVRQQQLGKAALTTAESFAKLATNANTAQLKIAEFRKSTADLLKADPTSPLGLSNQKNSSAIEAAIKLQYTSKIDKSGISQEETRAADIGKVNAQLTDQLKLLGLVGDEREKQIAIDKLNESLVNRKKPLAPLSPTEAATVGNNKQNALDAGRTNTAAESIYQSAIGPLQAYNSAIAASDLLVGKAGVSQLDLSKAVALAAEKYKESKDPLYNYNKGMQDSNDLLNLYGPALQVQQKLQALVNQQIAAGTPLTDDQVDAERRKIAVQLQAQTLQSAINSIYEDTIGKQNELLVQQQAIQVSYSKGYINLEQYTNKLRDLNTEQAKQKLASGNGNFNDLVTANVGNLTKGYTNVLDGLTTSFDNFFTGIEDGFANSIGQAVVHAKSLKEGLQDVAQTVESQLIASLIKLGIQYVVNKYLETTVTTTALEAQTALSVAAAATTAAAWTPAAAAVSLASFGANAGPASLGMIETYGLAKTLSTVTGFESGGYTGNGGRSAIAGVVHGQEFVANAAATARNRPALEAMNRGATVGGTQLNVSVANYAGAQIEVQQLSPTEVHIIATKAANQAVQSQTPGLVAAHLNDPNSKISQGVTRNTTAKRSRV